MVRALRTRVIPAQACANGHVDCVKCLVEGGADVNAVDRWRGTPLRDAEAGEHTETVAFCVEIATLPC